VSAVRVAKITKISIRGGKQLTSLHWVVELANPITTSSLLHNIIL